MDVAPKHVFLAATVPDDDRTAVFGFVNVVKTLAQIVGPSIVGILTENGLQWITFVIGGSLKVPTILCLGYLLDFQQECSVLDLIEHSIGDTHSVSVSKIICRTRIL
ncbi:unnamed protein product [Candida parapsilosis]